MSKIEMSQIKMTEIKTNLHFFKKINLSVFICVHLCSMDWFKILSCRLHNQKIFYMDFQAGQSKFLL